MMRGDGPDGNRAGEKDVIGLPRVPHDGLAIASLGLGVSGFFTCLIFLFGPLAIIFGQIAKRKAEVGEVTPEGCHYARIGVLLGWIQLGLVALVIVILLILFAVLKSGA